MRILGLAEDLEGRKLFNSFQPLYEEDLRVKECLKVLLKSVFNV